MSTTYTEIMQRLHHLEQRLNPILTAAGWPPLRSACCDPWGTGPATHGYISNEERDEDRRVTALQMVLTADNRRIIVRADYTPPLAPGQDGPDWLRAQEALVANVQRALA